jgi:hypothetical protein
VEEARLLAAVRRVLGHQVERLRMPPFLREEGASPFSAEGRIGVPVRPFPRWLRCVRCGLLAEYDSGVFEIKANLYRPDQTQFVHTNCEKGGKSDAVPARFLLACRNGHWTISLATGSFTVVHRNARDAPFFERGASLQTRNFG